MESPIPILPLPTPDAETEKLIRMKDEEVGRQQGRSRGWGRGQGQARPIALLTPPSVVPAPPPAKAHAGDAAENEAANAGPVTPPQPHFSVDILPVSRLALPTPGPRLAWTGHRIRLDR